MDAVARPTERGDGGFTLIEALITVALMSIAFVAVLGALTLMIATGSEHRGRTRAEAAARNAAEYVKSSSVTYGSLTCGSTPHVLAVPSVSTPYAVMINEVRGWNGLDDAHYDDLTCSVDHGAKLVELEITGPGPSTNISVVKTSS
jgi:type II secretory pathway pseudopilin PulG